MRKNFRISYGEQLIGRPNSLFQYWVTVHYNLISIVKPKQGAQYLKFILFWNNSLHVSGSLSVHYQESKTVHTASGVRVCHTGSVAAC